MFSTPVWRNLPIFVTSTFRDMHAERDHLMQVVFPELEERLRKRRCYLEPVDLRWGVETASITVEEEKELAVLRICLDEIERSRPFQIVLLGDRYGWVPPAERLAAAAGHAGIPVAQTAMSVTALEIEAGVFGPGAASQRCFVYCRTPLPYRKLRPEEAARYSDRWAGDAPAARCLARLKARLRARMPERVRNYQARLDAASCRVTGLEEFGRMVLEDLWSELAVWTEAFSGQEPQSWQDRQRTQVADFFAHQVRGFVGHESTLDRLQDFALGQQEPAGIWGLCLVGPPGSGKSALLARLHALLIAQDVFVLAHTPGAAEQGALVNVLLRRWIEELGQFLGESTESLEAASPARLDELFADRLERAARHRRIVVLLDALDQLEPTDRGRFLGWLPYLWPDNARLIATAVPADATWAFEGREGCHVEPVAELTQENAVEIANTICRRYHRDLNPDVRRTLLARADQTEAPAFGNPLWLTLAVEYLNSLDMDDFVRADLEFAGTPEQRLVALLLDVARRMPTALADLYRWILDEAEARHGPAARVFAGLVALGRFGWRERDFHDLMPRLAGGTWTELQFGQLRRTFRAHLIERGGSGRWDFLHRSAREAVLADPRNLPAGREQAHRAIAEHLESLPADDPLRQGELMYHYVQAGARAHGAAYLAGALSPVEIDAAALALAGTVIDPNTGRGVDWIISLLWTGDLDRDSRAVLAQRLQDGLCRELARAGKTGAQAEILEAVKDFWRSAAAQERLPGDGRYNWARTARELGEIYRKLGRVEEAANAYVEGVTVVLESLKPPTSEPLRDRPLAEVAAQAGWEVAEPQWKSADWLEILALCQCGFGDLLTADGEFQEACEVYNRLVWLDDLQAPQTRALTDAREPLRRHADYVLYTTRLGYLALVRGMGHWAIASFQDALSTLGKLLDLDRSNAALARERAVLLGRMSQALRWQGAVRAATRTSAEAIRLMSELVGTDPSNREWQVCLGYFHLWHGDAWRARAEQARAEAHYRRAEALIARIAAADPRNGEWQAALAEVNARIGSSADATRMTAEAGEVGNVPAEDWDYEKPQVITTSSEEKRIAAMDPEDLACWRREVEPGPRFGDWRASLDKAEFVALERLESSEEGTVFEKTLERIRAAAELGDPQAQYKLGMLYWAGDVIPQNIAAAIAWLRRAAEQSLVGAQYDLGVVLASGDTLPHNPTEAVQWFTKAADQDHPQAQYNLGVAYARGRGVAADPSAASVWFRRAAEQDLAEAQYNLGVHHAEGFGAPQDYAEAVRWYRRAAEQGLAPAQHNLGWLYMNGQGVERDAQAAVHWWTEAARHRNPLAQNDLGTYYAVIATPRDYGTAAQWYRLAAEQGLAEAQCSIGILYLIGKGTERSVEEAAAWFNKAAAQGLIKAQSILGLMSAAATGQGVPPQVREQIARQPGGGNEIYRELLDAIDQMARERTSAQKASSTPDEEAAERGDPQAQYRLAVHLSQRAVSPDFATASHWYRKAAEQGLTEAKYNLGYLYLQGQGVEQDIRVGLDWIRAAANQGMAIAQYELGVFYSEGHRVKPDAEAAALWFRRAAEQGLPQAQHNLAHLYLEGRGVPCDREAAILWFERAAHQGFAPSQMMLFMLGQMPFPG